MVATIRFVSASLVPIKSKVIVLMFSLKVGLVRNLVTTIASSRRFSKSTLFHGSYVCGAGVAFT